MFFNKKKRALKAFKSQLGQPKTEGFLFDAIKRYFDHKDHLDDFQELSDQTVEDLDFDLFFAYVDRTSSRVGQQFLYNELRTLNPDKDLWTKREAIIEYLDQNPDERFEIQYQLSLINNNQEYYVVDLFQRKSQPRPKWYVLIPIIALLSLTSLIMSFFVPVFGIILLGLLPVNVFIHYALKRHTNLFILSIPALLAMGGVAKKLMRFKVFDKTSSDTQNSIKVISNLRAKMSLFRIEQKVDSDLEVAYWFLIELLKITFLLEPLLLFSSVQTIQKKSKDIERVYRFVGEIDMLLSIHDLRKGEHQFCIPEIQEEQTSVEFKDLRHPLISDCVKNSISGSKSLLLTGSNMSGKTTFIRAVGLNFIAGMSLNTCFASQASLPMSKLMTVIRIEDDLMNSSSYFFKEVNQIKLVIDELDSGSQTLVLLDEIFKGTNTKERIASAKAILSYLSDSNSQIMVSTHDLELTNLLKNEYNLFYFSETIKNGKVHFDYKLRKGVLETGNAIGILSINQYPQKIVEEANALSASF